MISSPLRLSVVSAVIQNFSFLLVLSLPAPQISPAQVISPAEDYQSRPACPGLEEAKRLLPTLWNLIVPVPRGLCFTSHVTV